MQLTSTESSVRRLAYPIEDLASNNVVIVHRLDAGPHRRTPRGPSGRVNAAASSVSSAVAAQQRNPQRSFDVVQLLAGRRPAWMTKPYSERFRRRVVAIGVIKNHTALCLRRAGERRELLSGAENYASPRVVSPSPPTPLSTGPRQRGRRSWMEAIRAKPFPASIICCLAGHNRASAALAQLRFDLRFSARSIDFFLRSHSAHKMRIYTAACRSIRPRASAGSQARTPTRKEECSRECALPSPSRQPATSGTKRFVPRA